jgi:hypothetical protein
MSAAVWIATGVVYAGGWAISTPLFARYEAKRTWLLSAEDLAGWAALCCVAWPLVWAGVLSAWWARQMVRLVEKLWAN